MSVEPASAAAGAPPPLARLIALRLELLLAAFGLLLVLFVLALLWAPSLSFGFSAPVAQRAFYLHIGAALGSYLAFTVTFAASIAVLRGGGGASDRVAGESAALGLMLAAITIAAGSLWGWAEWGVPWRLEDERLMTYLVLFFVFVAYIAVRRRMPEGEARARTSALLAVAGYALVPFSYFSIYIWRTLHPRVISPGGQGIGGAGALVLIVSISAYTLLFLAFLAWRLELLSVNDRVVALQRRADA